MLECRPDVVISEIVFLPGSRTFWHTHERGQVLRVTSGTGWVCVKGEEPVALSAGDVVWAEPGEQHWHGASDGEILCHTAISLGETRWLDEVTDPYPATTTATTTGNVTAGPDVTDEETKR